MTLDEKIFRLKELWDTRFQTYHTIHNTDGILLGLIDDILKEQRRLESEHGFWWHIKAAFISLLARI